MIKQLFTNFIKKQLPITISIAPKTFKNDVQLISHLVERNGTYLRHASPDIQNNKEIVLQAINQNYLSLKYASNQLKNDKEFISQAILLTNGCVLENASDLLKCDREIVLQAVKATGTAYLYACDELKNDREIAIEAMKSDALFWMLHMEMLFMDLNLVYSDMAARFETDLEFKKEAIEIYSEVLEYTRFSLDDFK